MRPRRNVGADTLPGVLLALSGSEIVREVHIYYEVRALQRINNLNI